MGAMSSELLLLTKLYVPAARPDRVARPRLVGLLEEGRRAGRRLSLISAPPGFGKTTLIQEWTGALEGAVAWLTLDAGDDDAGRFVRYLRAAARGACAGLPEGPPDGADAPQAQMVALITDLAAAGVELTLVLDDYHLLGDFAIHDLVTLLLERRPPGLHLVVGTREDPPLPLARLRARDQVTEIRERDLRFSAVEAADFLGHTLRLTLSPETVAALAARAEGWVTGMQLAGLALRGSGGGAALTAEAAAGRGGGDRYVADYIAGEVLAREREPVREFLRRTSILDRLSGPLCAALTGDEDAQATLEYLVTANLFVMPLDNRREWFRYHALFAEVLRLSLSAAEQMALHRRAAEWFAAHGPAEAAAQHARRADELAAAAGGTPRALANRALVEPLSEREMEVLRLREGGYSNAAIARARYIAVGTVKRHLNNIYGKLQAESRTQALAHARELGLL
jgi:LuxR family maltose regulon positive regulatory protein